MEVKIIEELKAHSSTNKKQEILAENKELLKDILLYTYNPLWQYYIKKLPKVTGHGSKTIKDVLPVLDALKDRVITGNAARELVEKTILEMTPEHAELFKRVLSKDLKVGVNAKLINKVYGNLIPLTPYMGAISYNEKKFDKMLSSTDYVYSEIKYDGLFCNLIVENGILKTISRQGKPLNLEEVFKDENLPDNYVLTGEILVKGVDRYTANGLINSYKTIMQKIKQGDFPAKEIAQFEKRYNMSIEEATDRIYMVAWDAVPLENWQQGKYEVELYKRREILKDIVSKLNKIYLVEYRICKTKQEVIDHFKEVLKQGLEGLVVKNPSSIWKDGKPNDIQKFKLIVDFDLRVTGMLKGNPGTAYENDINRLEVATECGKLTATVSGIKEDMMKWLNENDITGKIVTVECCGISYTNGEATGLLHPRFIEIRDDKNVANTLEECKNIEKSVFELEKIN